MLVELKVYDCHCRLAQNQGWSFTPFEIQLMEVWQAGKAINSVQVELSGQDVYRFLKFESE